MGSLVSIDHIRRREWLDLHYTVVYSTPTMKTSREHDSKVTPDPPSPKSSPTNKHEDSIRSKQYTSIPAYPRTPHPHTIRKRSQGLGIPLVFEGGIRECVVAFRADEE